MSGQIILLHGPSSSGKSTLALALRDAAPIPFWHFSIDHLRDADVLPGPRTGQDAFKWSALRKPFFDGFHGAIAAFAKAGNNLIIEHILDEPDWVVTLKQLLMPYDVFFVGVECDIDTLNRREKARGDRPIGSAARDYQTVHRGRVYDITVNGQDDALKNAALILKLWGSGVRRSEFAVTPAAASRIGSLPIRESGD
ncbi:chloramphenicol phosphotransferase [Yoonia sp. BS5-3]|uniref:Chloramphenicol phosphotransferase CPT family protein n=1 Tax=Yoonia phaeophyticola TaxID=3137369 RepID=A0ABZ2V9H2_9RHOB